MRLCRGAGAERFVGLVEVEELLELPLVGRAENRFRLGALEACDKLGVARVVFESIGLLHAAALPAHEHPPHAGRGFEQRARRLVGARGEVLRGSLVLEGEHELRVAVADDRVRGGRSVARFKLAYGLANDCAADLAAAYDRQHVVDVRQVQVREIVEHESHGHGQAMVGVIVVG